MIADILPLPTLRARSTRAVAADVLRDLVDGSGLSAREFARRLDDLVMPEVTVYVLHAWMEPDGPMPLADVLVAAGRIHGAGAGDVLARLAG